MFTAPPPSRNGKIPNLICRLSEIDRSAASITHGRKILAPACIPAYVYQMMPPLFAFSMPGTPEIIFILLIVLILFGAKKLPELARGIGQSLGEFKKAREEFEREVHKSAADVEVKEAPDKQPHKPV